MHHLEARRARGAPRRSSAGACRARAAACCDAEKWKKRSVSEPVPSRDPAQQRAPAAKRDLARAATTPSTTARSPARSDADRHDARAVLVALRQLEQQVLDGREAELRRASRRALGRRRAALVTAARAPTQRQAGRALQIASGTRARLYSTSTPSISTARAARQRRDADRGARRIRLAEVLRHDLVDERKVGEVGEVDGELHDAARSCRRPRRRPP